jgi:hypothetical protein
VLCSMMNRLICSFGSPRSQCLGVFEPGISLKQSNRYHLTHLLCVITKHCSSIDAADLQLNEQDVFGTLSVLTN